MADDPEQPVIEEVSGGDVVRVVVPPPLLQTHVLQTHDHIIIDDRNDAIRQLLEYQFLRTPERAQPLRPDVPAEVIPRWTTRVDPEDPTRAVATGTMIHEAPMEYIRMELVSREPLPMPPLPTILFADTPYRNTTVRAYPQCLGELMKKDGKNIDEIINTRAGEPISFGRFQPEDRAPFKEHLAKCGWTKRSGRVWWARLLEEGRDVDYLLRCLYNDYFSKRSPVLIADVVWSYLLALLRTCCITSLAPIQPTGV